jgi:hypothetical protein
MTEPPASTAPLPLADPLFMADPLALIALDALRVSG